VVASRRQGPGPLPCGGGSGRPQPGRRGQERTKFSSTKRRIGDPRTGHSGRAFRRRVSQRERPNTCRIYPAEIIPGLALKSDRRLCPPEAWDDRQPEYLSVDGRILDVVTDTATAAARAAGLREVGMRRALATALGIKIAALENEGFAVLSIPSDSLLPILRDAMQEIGDLSKDTPSPDWLFVSPRPEGLALITAAGAKAMSSPNHDQVSYLALYRLQ